MAEAGDEYQNFTGSKGDDRLAGGDGDDTSRGRFREMTLFWGVTGTTPSTSQKGYDSHFPAGKAQ